MSNDDFIDLLSSLSLVTVSIKIILDSITQHLLRKTYWHNREVSTLYVKMSGK